MFREPFSRKSLLLPTGKNSLAPNSSTKSVFLLPRHHLYSNREIPKMSEDIEATNSIKFSTANFDKAIRTVSFPQGKKTKRTLSPTQVIPVASKRSSNGTSSQLPEPDYCTDWKKDYHNAIEKKRRDHINTYIDDIHAILLDEKAVAPNCDKLSTLTAAVDYLKITQQTAEHFMEESATLSSSPNSIESSEFPNLMTSILNGFLLTFRCSDFTILFVSEGVETLLGWRPSQMLRQDFTNFIHPIEVDKFKENHRKCLCNYQTTILLKESPITYSSNFVHTVQGCVNEQSTQRISMFTILFTGGFKVISMPESEELIEDVLCFSAILRIIS